MLKSLLGTSCDVDRPVPWLRRDPDSPLFSPKPGVRWSKMCTARPPEFLFTFRLLLFSRLFSFIFCLALFCFLDKAGVFVGSSEVSPPVFPFFSPCLPCPFVFCFVCFRFLPSSSPFSSYAFITSSFLLRICVYICLFC